VVDRTVGVDHRILEQTVGIDVRKQAGHEQLQGGGRRNTQIQDAEPTILMAQLA
jgi:hypothetical protein